MSSQQWSTEVEAEIDGGTWQYLVVSGFQDCSWGPDDDSRSLQELRAGGHLVIWQVYGGPPDWNWVADACPSDEALLDAFMAQVAVRPPTWYFDT